ncbi:hypothetical protein [Streptomyces sp. NPDC007905]|uniref:hypothetical protein n=1 Tax=Streptomyces sp. NPDC007905 TaxID=3364788 RepID=UPI0036E6B10F
MFRHLRPVPPGLGDDATARYGRHPDDAQAVVRVDAVRVVQQLGEQPGVRRHRCQAPYGLLRVDAGHADQSRAVVVADVGQGRDAPPAFPRRRGLRLAELPFALGQREQVRCGPGQAQPPR